MKKLLMISIFIIFALSSCSNDNKNIVSKEQNSLSGNTLMNPLSSGEKKMPTTKIESLDGVDKIITNKTVLDFINKNSVKFDKFIIGDKTIYSVGGNEAKRLGKYGYEIASILNGFITNSQIKEIKIDNKIVIKLKEDGVTIDSAILKGKNEKVSNLEGKNIFDLLKSN